MMTQKNDLLQAIKYLKENPEILAPPIKPYMGVIDLIEYFINKLPKNKIQVDIIEPYGEFGLILKWKMVKGIVLLSFDENFLYLSHIKNYLHAPIFLDLIPFKINDEIPKEILEHIPENDR